MFSEPLTYATLRGVDTEYIFAYSDGNAIQGCVIDIRKTKTARNEKKFVLCVHAVFFHNIRDFDFAHGTVLQSYIIAVLSQFMRSDLSSKNNNLYEFLRKRYQILCFLQKSLDMNNSL